MMQSFIKIGIIFAFLSLMQGGFGQRCSWTEYGATVSLCWVPYGLDLSSRMLMTPPAGHTQNFYIDAFKGSCEGNRLSGAIKCHNRVDKFCGVQLIDMELLKKTVNKLCDHISDLLALPSCVQTKLQTIIAFINCLDKTPYDGDLCKLTASFKACMSPLFADCSNNVMDFMSSAQDLVFMSKCLPIPPVPDSDLPPCTAMSTLSTTGLCWAAFAAKLAGVAAMKGDVMGVFQATCRSGEIPKIMECQAAVNEECKTPLVNTQELKTIAETMCKNTTDLTNFATCVNEPKALDIGKCTTGITLKDTPDTLCTASNDFRQCFDELVNGCQDSLQTVMRQGYDVVSLSCPPGQKCTMIEHFASLGTCWLQTIQVMVPWPWQNETYNVEQRLTDFCGKHRSLIDQSIDCHDKAGERCDRTVISGTVLTGLVNGMCRNVTGLLGLSTCVDGTVAIGLFQCMLPLVSEDVSAPGYLCKAKDKVTECTLTLFDRCDDSVKITMKAILGSVFGTVKCEEYKRMYETTTPGTTPGAATMWRTSPVTGVSLLFVAAQAYFY